MSDALLTHRIDGDGEPLVLLNGGMMSFPAWGPIAEGLQRRFRVLSFDFRGQLLSPLGPDAPPRDDLAAHARDVLDLLDHLGWSDAHFVGTSFGSEVSLELLGGVARGRGLARSLTIITAMDRETPEFRAGADETRALIAQLLAGGPREPFYDHMVESVYSAEHRSAQAEVFAERKAQILALPDPWFVGVEEVIRALEDFDLGPRLPHIDCPTLVLVAADDQVMSTDRSQYLADALGAQVRTHPSSGHALVAEDPEWVLAACLDFLAAVGGSSKKADAVATGSVDR